MTLGRSRADLKFPKDGWVSGIHCQLMPVAGQVMLVDLKSSNGTFLRIRGLRPLAHGDALLMGQRIFHMQLG
jgi:pSer/pThr/pTyr-binding forkhead associated (FHA) protein